MTLQFATLSCGFQGFLWHGFLRFYFRYPSFFVLHHQCYLAGCQFPFGQFVFLVLSEVWCLLREFPLEDSCKSTVASRYVLFDYTKIFNLLGFFLSGQWNYFLRLHVLGPLHYRILAVSYVASSMSYRLRDCIIEFQSYVRISKMAICTLFSRRKCWLLFFVHWGFFPPLDHEHIWLFTRRSYVLQDPGH